jgi:hypothetical protein
MYVEYSGLYALAPQLALLAYVVWQHRWRALPILLAGAAAVVGYLPWLRWMLYIAEQISQQSQYGISPIKVLNVTMGVAGIAGNSGPLGPDNGGYFYSSKYAAWDFVPAMQPVLLAITAVVLVAGLWRLWRHSTLAFIAPACLLATLPAAILISFYRPGFIERTVIYAVLGWAIVVGAAAVLGRRTTGKWAWTWPRFARIAGIVLVLALSSVTLRSMYEGGLKQQWRELAAEAAHASRGNLLVTYPTLAGALVDAYQPDVLHAGYLNIEDAGDLPDLSQPGGTKPREVWLAYMEVAFIQKIRDQLQAQGYRQVSHKYFPAPLFLDHYQLSTPSP